MGEPGAGSAAESRSSRQKRPSGRLVAISDLAAALGLAAPLLYLGWHQGGVDPADQAIAFGWILLLTALWGILGHKLGAPLRVPWPAALLALVPLVQLIPLPQQWGLLSPQRQALAAQISSLGVERFPSISIYPHATLQGALLLAGGCAVFVLARALSRRGERTAWMLTGPILALGFVEAIVGIQQYLQGQVFSDIATPIAHGTFVNRDHYAALLECCFGLALGLAVGVATGRRRRHGLGGPMTRLGIAAAAIAPLYLLGVVFSFSRMGILVTLVTAAAALLLLPRGQGAGRLILGLALVAVVTSGVIGVHGLPDRFQQLLAERGDPARLAVWSDSLQVAREHLWAGSGLGTFPFAFHRSEMYLPRKTIDHAHCDYLEVLIEMGLPAALLLCGTIAFVMLRAGRTALEMGRSARGRMITGCLLGAGALLLHAAADFPLQIPVLAAVLAALLGCASGLADRREEPHLRSNRFAGAGAFLFACLGFFLWQGGASAWNAEIPFAQGQQASRRGEPARAEARYRQAVQANPYAGVVWLKRAELAETRGDVAAALSFAELAGRLEPHSFRTEWLLAHVLLRQGHLRGAAQHLARIAKALPETRPAILHSAWTAGMPPELITEALVPRERDAVAQYLYFLVGRGAWSEIVPACQTLALRDGPGLPRAMLRYTFDKLFETGRGHEIKALWNVINPADDLARTPFRIGPVSGTAPEAEPPEQVAQERLSQYVVGAGRRARPSPTPTETSVSQSQAPRQPARGPGAAARPYSPIAVRFVAEPDRAEPDGPNPGFAAQAYGLQWVQRPLPGVSVTAQPNLNGRHLLQIHFRQPANLDYSHLTHYFAVRPGRRYVLEAEVSSEAITGGEGIRLVVRSSRHWAAASEPVKRSTPWKTVRLQFQAGADEHVLQLAVVRRRSHRLDNLLSGKFFLENVRLLEADHDWANRATEPQAQGGVKESKPVVAQALSLQRRDSSRRSGLLQLHGFERDANMSRHECRLGKLRACATRTQL